MRLFRFSSRELCLIFLGGSGFFLGFPNSLIQIPPLVLLFPACMACLALEAESEAKAASCALSLLAVSVLGGAYWLVYPLTIYGHVPMPLAVFFILLLAVCASIYYIIFALILRFFYSRLPLLPALVAAACAWGALELARGHLFTGITWFSVSSAMPGLPIMAQGAALFGMFGLSTLYAFIAFSLAPLALRGRGAFSAAKLRFIPPLAGCLLLAALLLYGRGRLDIPFASLGQEVLIAQVQGNVDQAQKWLPTQQARTVNHYIKLSEQALRLARETFKRKTDLLVWPETAMPFYFRQEPRLDQPLRDLAEREKVPLLFGAPSMEAGAGRDSILHNRVWLLDEQGREAGSYDKEHLVPFGEYLPLDIYVPFASEFMQGMGFTPGQTERPLLYKNLALGALICYESLFPELAQARTATGANLLINISNDAWFADSAAPWQLLQLSAMRSIEQGRYMLRSTNTGASAAIDPAGRVQGLGPLFRDYPSAHLLSLLTEKTFFHRNYTAIHRLLALSPFFFIALALLRGIKNAGKGRHIPRPRGRKDKDDLCGNSAN